MPVMPRVKSNGIEIEYDTFGSEDAEPLLLIMGLGSQMILWREAFCEALAARGHFVIRFDNRDIGKSTYLEDLGVPDIPTLIGKVFQGEEARAPYALTDMAEDGFGLLSALGIDSAHVCGVSMGGMVAQTMALERPTRVRSLTSIMSTTGDRDLPPPQPEALAALMQPPVATVEGVVERALSIFQAIGSPAYPMPVEEVAARAREQFERGFNPAGMARQFAAILTQQGRREALASLRLPALVIHGDADALVPIECGRATAPAIPGAATLGREGMGHGLPEPLWPRIIDAIAGVTASARN